MTVKRLIHSRAFRVAICALILIMLTSVIVGQDGRSFTPSPSGRTSLTHYYAPSAWALAEAMDVPPEVVTGVTLGTSDPTGTVVATLPYSEFDPEGGSYAIISTGDALDVDLPNASEDLSTMLNGSVTSDGQDLVQLTLTMNVPAGADYWAVDWKFFSEEYPEFVGDIYNDAFLIETPVSDFTLSGSDVIAPSNKAFIPTGEQVTINATGAVGMTQANAVGTTYDGASEKVTTADLIPSGTTSITIVFSVFDMGDSIYDTTVFLDNFRFGNFFDGGISEPGGNQPPVIDSPVPGQEYYYNSLDAISIPITASDPDLSDTVLIAAAGMPNGATIVQSASNPVTATLEWTPTLNQYGVYVIPIVAYDNYLRGSALQSIVIDVYSSGDPERLYPVNDGAIFSTESWPRFQWAEHTGAEWYGIWIGPANYSSTVLYQWFPAQDSGSTPGVCNAGICTLPQDLWLTSGAYQWWMTYWGPNQTDYASYWNKTSFVVDPGIPSPPSGITSDPRQGRPLIQWNMDTSVLWVQLWMGGANNVSYLQWYGPDDYTCDVNLLICSVEPDVNWGPGTYQVWMSSWGPGGLSSGGLYDGWAEGAPFTLSSTAPAAPTNFTVTGITNVNATWDGMANATWYNVIVTDSGGSSVYNSWSLGYDLDPACGDALGACSLTDPDLDSALAAGSYTAYVGAWGPGGFSDYSQTTFTFTP